MKLRVMCVARLMLLVLCSTGGVWSDAAAVTKQDYWMGVYYRQTKIGSLHVTIGEDKADGKDRLCRSETLRVRYRVPGKSKLYNITHKAYTDKAFGLISDIVTSDYKDSSMDGYYPRTVELIFGPVSGRLRTTADGTTDERTQVIRERDRELFAAARRYDFCGMKLVPGEKTDINHFRLATPTPSESEPGCEYGETSLSVLRRETVVVDGISYDTLVVAEKGPKANITRWQLDNGEIVKQEMPVAHVVWLREPEKKAAEIDEGQGPLLDIKWALAEPERAPLDLDYWMGLYHGSTKLGSFHVTTRKDKLDGKDVYRRDEVARIQVNDSDGKCDVVVKHAQYVDTKMAPVLETVALTGTGGAQGKPITTTSENRFGRASVEVSSEVDGQRSSRVVSLDEQDLSRLNAGLVYLSGGTKLAVGQSIDANIGYYTITLGDAASCEWYCENVVLDVLRRETLHLNGVAYDTVVVSEKGKNGSDRTKWLLDSGEVVKVDSAADGVVWLKESREAATGAGQKPVSRKASDKAP